MPSTTELMQTELGKALVEAREKEERTKMSYVENVIGEKVVSQYNPDNALKYNPYAVAVARAFDKMVEKTIPQDAILSAQFQSWINREKNDLLYDSKIAKDNYFKEQTNFETGEVTINRKNDVLQAKMDYINNELGKLEKAFTTFLKNKPEQAFASEETLKKYQDYYLEKAQEVSKRLESGDFSKYDRKDKEGNVTKVGSEADAIQHQSNIDAHLAKVDNALAEIKSQQKEQNTDVVQDYVGDSIQNFHKKRM